MVLGSKVGSTKLPTGHFGKNSLAVAKGRPRLSGSTDDKNLQQNRSKGIYLNIIKVLYEKPIGNIILTAFPYGQE